MCESIWKANVRISALILPPPHPLHLISRLRHSETFLLLVTLVA